jgi:UDP-glucose 4-epimerase
MILKNKTVLVTGGTGSLGQRLIKRILSKELGQPKKIIVFSRDESKQHDMRVKALNSQKKSDNIIFNNFKRILEFRIGDIRNYSDIYSASKEADIIVNCAALKHVPVCEYFPEQAILTNCIGSINLIKCIYEHDLPVETIVGISTDKAASPVNVMGMTKSLQERILVASNIFLKKTKVVSVRYGNVIASRGSVIPLFIHQIKNQKNLTVTNKEMTRFLLSLDEAVDTVFFALKNANSGDIIVPKAPSCKILDLAEVLSEFKNYNGKIVEIGERPAEKLHEVMVTSEESRHCFPLKNYFTISPMLPELKKGLKKNIKPILREYSSESPVITKAQLKKLLIDKSIIDNKNNFLD